MPVFLEALVTSVATGFAPTQAWEQLALSFPEPLQGSLRKISAGATLHHQLATPLIEMARTDAPWAPVALAFKLSHETGCALSPILSHLAHTLKQEQHYKEKVSNLTLQGKVQGYCALLLPWLVLFSLYLFEPQWIIQCLFDPMGRLAFLVATLLQIAAFLFIKKIAALSYD